MKAKIAITIETEMLAKIDKMAEELNLKRSQFIENVLAVGLADAQLLKTLGFIDVAKMVMRVKDKISKRITRRKNDDAE